MSGKSTLLRSVGTAVALALAGAPVRAQRLRLSPLALGASLRVQDSLQRGRVALLRRAPVRCAAWSRCCEGPLPVLFLLDEILQGTNSHDRGIGATGLVHGLLARGAIGLVTTHDLALTAIVDELATARATRTSRTSSATASCTSTTGCATAWCGAATRSR